MVKSIKMSASILLESSILIKPSKMLSFSIKKINPDRKMPNSKIKNIYFDNSTNGNNAEDNIEPLILSTDDYDKLKSLDEKYKMKHSSIVPSDENIEIYSSENRTKDFLRIDDLLWLCKNLNNQDIYLHEFLKSSTVFVPENKKIERNPALEERCKKLKIVQENKKYQSITKNVDNVRVKHPEDTIQYQMKALNRQLLVIFQFILSVATGFVFGFIGIELMTGKLDFVYKLLLGIMCSLIVALAELYFLVKQMKDM